MSVIRKHTQNQIIDLVSFFGMIFLVGTGIILQFILPAGSRGSQLLGLTRHEWGDIHFWIAFTFTIVVSLHLVLHYSWIKGSYFTKKKK